MDWDHINPATGPIYVEGAEPGDLLAVHMHKIELAERGVMTTGPGMGVLGDELTENVVRMIPIKDGKSIFDDDIALPLRPMIGVIGTAPAGEDVPCGTPGALFALGDLHASMGDGEVAVCGIEFAGAVTAEFRVLKDQPWRAPMVIDDNHVMTIGAHHGARGTAALDRDAKRLGIAELTCLCL